MTIEEIVEEIQNGRTDRVLELWNSTEKFIAAKARTYSAILNGSRQVEVDDLQQAGFLALVEAAKGYQPGEAGFLTYLSYHLKNHFRIAAGLYTKKQINDPLFSALRIEAPAGEDGSLFDSIAGENNEIEAAEDRIWRDQLRAALDNALDHIQPTDADAIRRRYLNGQSLQEAAEAAHVSPERIRQRSAHGLRQLRQSARRLGLEEYIDLNTNFYKGTHFNQSNESPVEHLAILREEMRKRNAQKPAETQIRTKGIEKPV